MMMIDKAVGKEVRGRKLTYLSGKKLRSLFNVLDSVELAEVKGDFLEFGVALGGSGICLARNLGEDRRYLGFDVFGMIPPPSEMDGDDVMARYRMITEGKARGIGGETYYGYIDNLKDLVKANFEAFDLIVDDRKILLIEGLFEDTLPTQGDATIAVAHIDCDWYEPVKSCLAYIWSRLSPGGYVVLDDYNDWAGCTKATDEFLANNPEATLIRRQPHAVLVKPLGTAN